jgi:hypothetical protein
MMSIFKVAAGLATLAFNPKGARRQMEARPHQETVAHTFCDVFREEDARGLAEGLLRQRWLRSLTSTGMSVALTEECKRRCRDGIPFGTEVLFSTKERAKVVGAMNAATVLAGGEWWQAVADIVKLGEVGALPESVEEWQSEIAGGEELMRRGLWF